MKGGDASGREKARDARGNQANPHGQQSLCGQRREPQAVEVGDLAHAQTRGFKRRVSEALAVVERAVEIGTIGVSFSGGKDSTVLLDLVRSVVPDAPAAHYDSGCELPDTMDMVAHYGVTRIKTQMSLKEMCRYGGYWGHTEQAANPDAEFDFFGFLVEEPSERFAYLYGLDVMAIGLRAAESGGRRLSAYRRGEVYRVKSGMWHLCPLAFWSDDDVWAYIASRNLRYNVAYDRMAELGVPRKGQRVGILLGLTGAATEGRYAWLRQAYPGIWNELVAEFPKIKDWT